MASKAQINEQKWADYVAKLEESGLKPTEEMVSGYETARQFWNTTDQEDVDLFRRVVLGGR